MTCADDVRKCARKRCVRDDVAAHQAQDYRASCVLNMARSVRVGSAREDLRSKLDDMARRGNVVQARVSAQQVFTKCICKVCLRDV